MTEDMTKVFKTAVLYGLGGGEGFIFTVNKSFLDNLVRTLLASIGHHSVIE